ncbi:unnamed protein product [Brassicogethes aeneus]|uniref:3-dehydrosphinganine reductase n=1 Tax=Brassicogethes aeneus TaxID=1431903 RepID=A0A9P0FLM5_BRAAE|nr:unnamed protein product [Brassicogethes aeneus]
MFLFVLLPVMIVTGIYKLIVKNNRKSIEGKHVVVTGGSSGIGKAVAVMAAKEGANVTILARNLEKLTEAEEEIKKACINNDQIISKVSVDVSNYEAVENNLCEIEETVAPIYMLINCAGMAICGVVEEYTIADIKKIIDVNYLGTLYPIKAIIPKFKERKEGIVVLTASQVALMGMYGYSVYSSVKFALRGLAESLYQEVKPYGIGVTLSLPPDTDTPGFENENKSKPLETKLLSENGGLHQPETVAKKLLDDALTGKFFSYIGFESFILTTLCVGMSPIMSVFDTILQIIILGPLRAIGCFYINKFDKIILDCYKEKSLTKKSQ